MSNHWAQRRERGTFGAMRLGIFLLNLVGYWVGLALGTVVTAYFFVTGSASRRASRQYLARLAKFDPACGVKSNWWHAFRHHWDFGVNIIDRMWFWQGKLKKFHFHSEGREHLERQDGRGALLVGSHMGSFDAMRALSNARGVRINVVMYRAHAVNINRLFETLSPESNVQVIEMEPGDPNAMITLQKRVEQGEVVALLADRVPPFGRPRHTMQSFLGKPAPFAHNPWILASLLGCPVLTALCVRTGMRRYRVEVRPLTERVVLPRKAREAALADIIARYAAFLENACCQHPYQWFNFYDYWAPIPASE